MSRYLAQRTTSGWCVLDSTTGSVVSEHGAGRSGADDAASAVLRLESHAERTPDVELRAWRKARGLTQTQLAAALGVTWLTVQRWEAGTREPPAYLRLALKQLESEPVA